MEEVERMNAIIVHLNQWAVFAPQQDPYAMKVDRGNRNCYNCRDFEHLARNCRNRRTEGRIEKNKRLEYRNGSNRQSKMIEGGNKQSNLNGE